MTREECSAKLNAFEHGNDCSSLLLYVPEKDHIIVFEQGSSSQLIDEDYEQGYDSYIMATVINVNPYVDDVGEIIDDGEQYPYMYSTEKVSDEYTLVYDWLHSFYFDTNNIEYVPNVQVIRI